MMKPLAAPLFPFLLAALFPAISGIAAAEPARSTSPADWNLTELEERVAVIDLELSQLAEYSLRTGVGAVGYRSNVHSEPHSPEWVQIDLEPDTIIDQVVLVPTIWRDSETGLRADGFPREFRILTGSSEDPVGQLRVTVKEDEPILPRIAPYVIDLPPTPASWIRLETDTLSPRLWDGKFVLQLSELLVFSGEENVALHRPVQTSSAHYWLGYARDKRFLVDGFVPYLMNTGQGTRSVAFNTSPGMGEHPCLMIDLETEVPVNRIHLHGPDLSDTIPQALPDGYGIARHWRVEGANLSDFSDANFLCDYRMGSIYDVGPNITLSFPPTVCRYIRLTAVKPYMGFDGTTRGSQIALAEIEVFSLGHNVALGKRAYATFTKIPPERSFAALTDGRNFYGTILPFREWLEQLALRHDLETERPAVLAELNRRFTLQKRNLKWMGWLAAALTAAIIIIALVDRIIRLREIVKLKERIAADMHDELGANIHTIGLLSDAASISHDSPEELRMINSRIRQMTERAATAVRHCTNMMEAKELYIGLAADIRRTAQRNMAGLEHEITIEGEEHIERLKPRTRIDLFLFYKECLINVCRHSGASKFATRLKAERHQIALTITDNGRGLADLPKGQVPSSLSRRAKLLGASLRVTDLPPHGTSITLLLKTKRFGFRK